MLNYIACLISATTFTIVCCLLKLLTFYTKAVHPRLFVQATGVRTADFYLRCHNRPLGFPLFLAQVQEKWKKFLPYAAFAL